MYGEWQQQQQSDSDGAGRPCIYIMGIAYPHVRHGRDNPGKISCKFHKDRSHYHEPGHMLHDDEFKPLNMIGKPIQIEHGGDATNIGEIFTAKLSKDGKRRLRISAKIYTDTDYGALAKERILAGDWKGLSIRYDTHFNQDSGQIYAKEIKEVSVVKDPFFGGCTVEVAGSKVQKHKFAKTTATCNSTQMEGQPQQQQEPAAAAAQTQQPAPQSEQQQQQQQNSNRELLETVEQSSAQLKQTAEENARLKALVAQMEKKLAPLVEKEQQELAKHRAEQQKLALSVQDYHKELNDGKELPEEHKKAIDVAFQDPTMKSFQQISLKASRLFSENKKTIADLRAQVERLEVQNKAKTAAIAASKTLNNRSLDLPTDMRKTMETYSAAAPTTPSFQSLFTPISSIGQLTPKAKVYPFTTENPPQQQQRAVQRQQQKQQQQQAPPAAAVASVAASGASVLPREFGHSLRFMDPASYGRMQAISPGHIDQVLLRCPVDASMDMGGKGPTRVTK